MSATKHHRINRLIIAVAVFLLAVVSVIFGTIISSAYSSNDWHGQTEAGVVVHRVS